MEMIMSVAKPNPTKTSAYFQPHPPELPAERQPATTHVNYALSPNLKRLSKSCTALEKPMLSPEQISAQADSANRLPTMDVDELLFTEADLRIGLERSHLRNHYYFTPPNHCHDSEKVVSKPLPAEYQPTAKPHRSLPELNVRMDSPSPAPTNTTPVEKKLTPMYTNNRRLSIFCEQLEKSREHEKKEHLLTEPLLQVIRRNTFAIEQLIVEIELQGKQAVSKDLVIQLKTHLHYRTNPTIPRETLLNIAARQASVKMQAEKFLTADNTTRHKTTLSKHKEPSNEAASVAVLK
jgi:hypothetical protein